MNDLHEINYKLHDKANSQYIPIHNTNIHIIRQVSGTKVRFHFYSNISITNNENTGLIPTSKLLEQNLKFKI